MRLPEDGVLPVVVPPTRPVRFAAFLGGGMILGHLGQLAWLIAGSRAMSRELFGIVLSAQALYAVLQNVVDNGAGFHGARMAAGGRLSPALRASIIRIRLQLSLAGAALAAAVGLLGGAEAFLAIAPFAGALVLWALFGYWERFGLGEGGPWSAYLVARSSAPAIAAAVCLAASVGFPAPLAGVTECAAILIVAGAFGLRPRLDLAAALSAGRGPWRDVVAVGSPPVLWQIALSSGTVMLSTFGAPAAAAVYGVAIRLLTGLNQLAAVAATAFFPRLAAQDRDEADERGAILLATRVALALTAAANAVVLIAPAFVVQLFVSSPDREAEQTAIVVVASAVASSSVIVLSWMLVARRRELIFLRATLVGTSVVVTGGLGVILLDARPKALAMAIVFLGAQLLTAGVLLWGAATVFPTMRRTFVVILLTAVAVAGAGIVGAEVDAARTTLAVAMSLTGVLAALSILASNLRRARTQHQAP